MKESTESSVSKSLETRTEMLPYMPELLTDLWAMGCSLESIMDLVKSLDLPPKTSVLDLGCGKGAVSVTLAKALGFKVLGIDACASFLQVAKSKAVEFGVSDLCRFEQGDIREYIMHPRNHDIVVYASLGSILGNHAQRVAALRRMVRSGGYIIIDDGFLKGDKKLDRAGYEDCLPHEETLRQLTAQGDALLREIITQDESQSINEQYMVAIRKRGEALILRKPESKSLITEYIENQEEECRILDQYVTGAAWLIQRSD